jgi:uncharacterized protein (DUF58 family)
MGNGDLVPVRVMLDGTDSVIEIPVENRGPVESSAVELRVSWPAGLLTVHRWTALEIGALAYPRYMVPGSCTPTAGGLSGEEASRRGQGDEFVGLREYQQGDSWRRIHWPTTARRGDLMVVETAIEAERPARYRLLLLRRAPPAAQELAVGIAASLVAGHVWRGEPFGLRIGDGGQDLRRWPEVMGQLAMARAELATLPARDDGATTVVADQEGVAVDARGAVERLPVGVDLAGARSLLESLR